MPVLTFDTVIQAPLDRVWNFFRDPGNLVRLTPARLGARIRRVEPDPVRAGTRIELVIHLGPLPITWVSLIERFEPPHLFLDRQVQGPFARFVHEHRFESLDRQRTRIVDRLDYELPLGSLGALVGRAAVARRLESVFAHRARRVRDLLEDSGAYDLGG